uniref:Uncharacterized protein n=1 Tax=Myotis myotis TaxID=51298 RepID=A0A7J7XI76_MYOMY|nr:hypothetical protein mMyoMyo1_011776 [Myotis myotis]
MHCGPPAPPGTRTPSVCLHHQLLITCSSAFSLPSSSRPAPARPNQQTSLRFGRPNHIRSEEGQTCSKSARPWRPPGVPSILWFVFYHYEQFFILNFPLLNYCVVSTSRLSPDCYRVAPLSSGFHPFG